MKTGSHKTLKWWCAILQAGVFLFFAVAVYGGITYWTNNPHFSIVQRLAGLGVSFISLLLLLTSQLFIIKLSRTIGQGNIFSRKSLHQARSAFIFFLAWTIYAPLQRTAECLIATMHNPVGHRLLSISVGMPDLIRILILAILAFFMFILQDGIDLSEDQSLTI